MGAARSLPTVLQQCPARETSRPIAAQRGSRLVVQRSPGGHRCTTTRGPPACVPRRETTVVLHYRMSFMMKGRNPHAQP
jgi:hypothetical protein